MIKYLLDQREMRANTKKPMINSRSQAILNDSTGWRPLYKRTNDVLSKKKHAIGKQINI